MSTQQDRTGAAATRRLTEVLGPVVAAAGYDLEEVHVRAAGTRSVVRVVVDRDSGVSLDEVAAVSRALSEALDADEDDPGRPPYVLEVTSPGVDRPLTLPRHWARNTGRLVTTSAGGQDLLGRVVAVDDAGVTLAVEKGGAKKGQVRKAAGHRTVGWAELGEGRVQVEFNRPAGHRDEHLVHDGPDDSDDGGDSGDDTDLTADDVDDELDGAPADDPDDGSEPGSGAEHPEPHEQHEQHEGDRPTAAGAQDRGEQ